MPEPDQQLALAPGAGSGLGKKLAEALLAEPDFLSLLRDAFLDGLRADMWFYDKYEKKWTSEPDYKTRLAAGQAIMANVEGEPIKRVLVAQGSPGKTLTDRKAVEKIASSPALQGALERRIAQARARQPVDPVSAAVPGPAAEADEIG